MVSLLLYMIWVNFIPLNIYKTNLVIYKIIPFINPRFHKTPRIGGFVDEKKNVDKLITNSDWPASHCALFLMMG